MSGDTFQAGYEAGMIDVLRLVRENGPRLREMLERMKPALDRIDAAERERAKMSPFARSILLGEPLPAEDPISKAARTKQLRRILRDEGQAVELAALIRAGHTTETARAKMKIGLVRAKRIRAIAVRMKWIDGRRKRTPE